MKKLLILTIILFNFSIVFSQKINIQDYKSISKELIKENINQNYSDIIVTDFKESRYLIACWTNEDEYPVAYYIYDVKLNLMTKQVVPKGKNITLKVNTKLNETGDFILYTNSQTEGIYNLPIKIILKNNDNE